MLLILECSHFLSMLLPLICVILILCSLWVFPLYLRCLLGNMRNVDVQSAKLYTKVGLQLNLIILEFISAIYILFRGYIPYIFTDQEDVIHSAHVLLIIKGILMFPDGFQGAAGRIIRGLGEQYSATIGAFISYYPIMQPCAILLAFSCGLEVEGLWIAGIIGSISNTLYYSYIIYTTD